MVDLQKIKTVYFVGIKGVGMTALAIVAREMGMRVLGSDVSEEFPTDELLKKYKIPVFQGFKRENLLRKCYDRRKLAIGEALVVVTGAHQGLRNPEAVAAKEMGLPVLSHGEALGLFMKQGLGLFMKQGYRSYRSYKSYQRISVAGSHGKTTTAAMIAHLLTKAGFDPSFAIGCGKIKSLGTSGHFGGGPYFIAEADEYVTDPTFNLTPRFLYQSPTICLFTNIDWDHPDVFSSISEVKKVFLKFAQKLPSSGLLIGGGDSQAVREIAGKIRKRLRVLTYGFSAQNDFQITHISLGGQRTFFRAKFGKVNLGEFVLQIPGKMNIENAAASCLLANHLGLPWEKIKEYLSRYEGAKRRFELIAEVAGVRLYDDYAHHPQEIKATLSAARSWFPQSKLTVIFQPHTFSRTKALFSQFAQSFQKADKVIITAIYASAREKDNLGINSEMLVSEAQKYHPRVIYAKDKKETLKILREMKRRGEIREGEVIFTMGAGDIFRWHKEIMKVL